MEFELATVAVQYIPSYLINTSVLVLIYFKRRYLLIDIQLVALLKFFEYYAMNLKNSYGYNIYDISPPAGGISHKVVIVNKG